MPRRNDQVDPAEFYTGLIAEAYGELKGATFDPARYEAFVRANGEPALEIGCGDGEPLLDLVAAGLEVDGLDSSADMIDRAGSAAGARGLTTRLIHQRMEQMDTGRRYRSIYLAGPTFTLLPDDETCAAALRAIAAHLAEVGAVLVPLWLPPPTDPGAFGVARESTTEAGVRLRYTPLRETYDQQSRTRSTRVRYERSVPGEAEQVLERDWIIHWQTPETFAQLCASAGLAAEFEATGPEDEEFTAVLRHAR